MAVACLESLGTRRTKFGKAIGSDNAVLVESNEATTVKLLINMVCFEAATAQWESFESNQGKIN
jgi:hypothetical protein